MLKVSPFLYSQRFRPGYLVGVLAVVLGVGVAGAAGDAEGQVPRWEADDEATHLERVAEHESEQMRFRLINTRVRDKNDIWGAFAGELVGFADRYEDLKPRILNTSIAAVQGMVAAGELSYEELTKFYIYRIRAVEADHDRYLNAIIALNPEAIAEARRADQRRRSEQRRRSRQRRGSQSPLLGIPVLLKDNIGFEGLPTTAGALALGENFTADAFIVRRLQEAGAVVLGKANLSEWAYFFCGDCPSGYSAIGGQTMNPYGRFDFTPGGSSSGTGAAVAADYAVVGVGTETSGSILSPASANSLVGLKPTTGSLSRSGIVPISATLDTAGPMGRSVADVVLLFNGMAGYDEGDTAMPKLSEDLRLEYRLGEARGKRLGAPLDYLDDPLFAAALSVLSGDEAGALVVEVEIPEFDGADFGEFLGGDMVRDLAVYLAEQAGAEVSVRGVDDIQRFNEEDMALRAPYGQALMDMMAALELTPQQLATIAEDMQGRARAALDALFADHGLDALLSINNFNAGIAALANYPALTVPMGYTEEGRPMNLTLIAPAFHEQDLIDIGAVFERLSRSRRPPEGYE